MPCSETSVPTRGDMQPEPQPTQLCQSTHNRKPSRQIRDLQSGKGIILTCKGSPRVMISL